MRFGSFEFPLKIIYGLDKVILPEVRKPEKEIDPLVARVARKYFLEQTDGVIEFKLGLLQNAKGFQNLKVFGSNAQGLLIGVFRSVVVPGVFFSTCLFEKRLYVTLRLQRECWDSGPSHEGDHQQNANDPQQGAAQSRVRACRGVH